jgi:hypothetical protein
MRVCPVQRKVRPAAFHGHSLEWAMDMLFAYLFSTQMLAALLAAGMVILGGTRYAARRAYVRARIAERCKRMVDSSCR